MASETLLDCPKVENFPKNLYGAGGGIVDGFPMICSGIIYGVKDWSNTCHSLNQHGQWIEDQNAQVNPGRSYSGYEVIQNQLFMVGGKTADDRFDRILALKPNTTTIKWNSRLPHGLSSACVVPWSGKIFLVTGGNAGSGGYESR